MIALILSIRATKKEALDSDVASLPPTAEVGTGEEERPSESELASERLPTPKQHTAIETEGGAYIDGNVLAKYDVIGRDKTVIHIYPTTPQHGPPSEIELLLAFDKWWESIKDYELSMGEMGSASEAEILPQDSEMAIHLEDFRVSKIKAWPFLGEETRNAFDQAERVFLGFIASVYGGIYNHEVFGDQVPEEIMRNEQIEEIIVGNALSHTFSECKQAYRKLRSQLMD